MSLGPQRGSDVLGNPAGMSFPRGVDNEDLFHDYATQQ